LVSAFLTHWADIFRQSWYANELSRIGNEILALDTGFGDEPASPKLPEETYPFPTADLLYGLVGSVVALAPCVALMLIGAAKARRLMGRRLVMASLIIAITLAGISAISLSVKLQTTIHFSRMLGITDLLLNFAATMVLVITAVNGFLIMRRPEVKAAFGSTNNL
jgi:hypothetical protein